MPFESDLHLWDRAALDTHSWCHTKCSCSTAQAAPRELRYQPHKLPRGTADVCSAHISQRDVCRIPHCPTSSEPGQALRWKKEFRQQHYN